MSADPKPIRWRLRRGMRELDVLLTRWYDERHAQADAELRAQFVALLDQEDPDIWNWVMGRSEPRPEFAAIIAALVDRA